MKLGVVAGFRKPGKRQDGLADHPRDHGGPGEKGSAPMTEPERSEDLSAFRPPLRLEISLQDLPADLERVDVIAYVGAHRTMHRSVVVALDAVGDIPLTVESDLYKWVSWLLEEQRQRARAGKKRSWPRPPRHPQWPSPTSLVRQVRNQEDLGEAL